MSRRRGSYSLQIETIRKASSAVVAVIVAMVVVVVMRVVVAGIMVDTWARCRENRGAAPMLCAGCVAGGMGCRWVRGGASAMSYRASDGRAYSTVELHGTGWGAGVLISSHRLRLRLHMMLQNIVPCRSVSAQPNLRHDGLMRVWRKVGYSEG